MLPKAVLSWVGRLVGIAAVVASPLVAQAAEASDTQSPSVAKDAHKSAAPHSHAKKARKKSAHAAASRTAVGKDDKREAKPSKASPPKDEVKSDKASGDTSEVIAEHASTRSVPKPSKTPLPTVAAAATCPLLAVKARDAAPVEKNLDRGHAIEPRKTPILRASTRPDHAEPVTESGTGHAKAKKAKPPCLNAPIEVTRGSEDEAFPLTKCDGSVLPSAVDQLSVLVRPSSAARPQTLADESKNKNDEIAPGIKRIDARLVERVQLVVDHFAKPGKKPQLFVVSGYRPASKGSFHANGRAIDFRLEGVENTDLVAFCKTLDDTGCGFYPNSSFIHMDVRDTGSGHVAWIDASAPGEKPDYVAAWPPPPEDHDADAVKLLARLDELEFLPKEEASEKKPLDTMPAPADAKPADAKPADTKPASAKSACAAGEEDAPAAVVGKARESR